MKETRLEKTMHNENAYKYIFQLYKETKKTRDIHKILAFKSFIARIRDAQWEYDELGRKIWADLDLFVTDVIMKQSNPLKFIINMVEQEHAYGYNIKRDLRRTL